MDQRGYTAVPRTSTYLAILPLLLIHVLSLQAARNKIDPSVARVDSLYWYARSRLE